MNLLEEFREDIENFANEKLTNLDAKIARVEERLTSLDFKEQLFRLEKKLNRIEKNKFGYSLSTSTNNNGDN